MLAGARRPRVHDVLHEEDVPALERRVHVLQESDAAALPVGVRGELDDVECVRYPQRASQVREEHDARLQWGDEDGIEAGVLATDLRPQLGDTSGDVVARQVDVADVAVLGSPRLSH
jgi:hypothetical protein